MLREQRLNLADLPDLGGRGVRVAVIDSGVHATHPHVQGVAGGVGIDEAGAEHADYVDRLGHGTAVAAAIREKAPHAELWAIKVFDGDLRTTGAALAAAIEWAASRGSRLVNLSLGTTSPVHELRLARAVASAREAGATVVAAAPTDDARWLPGCLAGVVAVELDAALPREACVLVSAADGSLRARASGYPRPIPGVPRERNLSGVSFAVANVTGLLARALERVPPGTSLDGSLTALLAHE
jgi:subtilisin family serine protease